MIIVRQFTAPVCWASPMQFRPCRRRLPADFLIHFICLPLFAAPRSSSSGTARKRHPVAANGLPCPSPSPWRTARGRSVFVSTPLASERQLRQLSVTLTVYLLFFFFFCHVSSLRATSFWCPSSIFISISQCDISHQPKRHSFPFPSVILMLSSSPWQKAHSS